MKIEKISSFPSISFVITLILSSFCHFHVTATGEPVRCSVCSSAPNREGLKCIEHPEDYFKDCNTGPPQNASVYKEFKGCWKIEQSVLYDGPEPNNSLNNDTRGTNKRKAHDDKNSEEAISRALRMRHHRIIRSCAYHEGVDGSCINRGSSGWSQSVCWCKKESCNTSTSTYPSIISLVFLFFISSPLFNKIVA